MQSTECDFHPQMIRASLEKHDILDALGIKSFSFGTFPTAPGVLIHAEAEGDARAGSEILALVPSGSRDDDVARGRRLDPRYIDINLVRRWRRSCDSQKQDECRNPPFRNLTRSVQPAYLIDTWSQCLVPGHESVSYVALSYVWGKKPFFSNNNSQHPHPSICQCFPRLTSPIGGPPNHF